MIYFPLLFICILVWFGAILENSKPGEFGLVGCTVTPAFVYREFELANRDILLKEYPKATEIIELMTLPSNEENFGLITSDETLTS
jgi:predicted cupin superfamily sugar epimerase